jgi:putative transposase
MEKNIHGLNRRTEGNVAYDYRKMTLEEQREIVLARRAEGHPFHSPPHMIRAPGYFLITAACYEHASILSSPQRRTEFEARLLSSLRETKIDIDAWVILTNHYHILIHVPDFTLIPAFFKRLHNGTSYEWNRADGCSGKRKVWYHYFDHFIHDEDQYYQAMNYIHYNPVKHAYVDDPYTWEWSSLGLYEEIEGREWLRKTWSSFPPRKLNFDKFDC